MTQSYMMIMMIQRDPKACKGKARNVEFRDPRGSLPQRVLAAPMHQPSRVHPQFLTYVLHV